MADTAASPKREETPKTEKMEDSLSPKVYWLLIILLPTVWWISWGGATRDARLVVSLVGIAILLTGMVLGFYAKVRRKPDEEESPAEPSNVKKPWYTMPNNAYWMMLFGLSIGWWVIAGNGSTIKSIHFAALSLAAFMGGTLVAFVFCSFGEELATFGKIRDWIVAGVTGATFAELAEQGGVFKKVLGYFATSDARGEFGLILSMAVVYFALGFLYMFLQRELVLNVLLAKSRAERGRLDGTVQTGVAIQKLLSKLPPSLLTGVADLDPATADEAKKLLENEDIKTFLSQADEALSAGQPLDWDTVSKVAYIYYYKVILAPEDDKKTGLLHHAYEWVKRALILNPMHVDLAMKYSELCMIDKDYDDAIALLEQMVQREDAPVYATQWLSYVLLEDPDRLQEAIRCAHKFLTQFPNTSESYFNLACSHAKLYCQELRKGKKTSDHGSENREKALQYLEEALRRDPEYLEHVQKNYSEKGKPFECMAHDPGYKKVVGLTGKHNHDGEGDADSQ